MANRIFQEFVQLIEDAGGYVNSDLQLLVGDEAEHGMVSLDGVADDVLALRVPRNLGEQVTTKGGWVSFLESLGYEINRAFFIKHSFADGVMPLLGAANHSENGGRIVETKETFDLYGTTFCYSSNKDVIRKRHGIS